MGGKARQGDAEALEQAVRGYYASVPAPRGGRERALAAIRSAEVEPSGRVTLSLAGARAGRQRTSGLRRLAIAASIAAVAAVGIGHVTGDGGPAGPAAPGPGATGVAGGASGPGGAAAESAPAEPAPTLAEGEGMRPTDAAPATSAAEQAERERRVAAAEEKTRQLGLEGEKAVEGVKGPVRAASGD